MKNYSLVLNKGRNPRFILVAGMRTYTSTVDEFRRCSNQHDAKDLANALIFNYSLNCDSENLASDLRRLLETNHKIVLNAYRDDLDEAFNKIYIKINRKASSAKGQITKLANKYLKELHYMVITK